MADKQTFTRDEAVAKIKEWAERLEVDTDLEGFKDVIDELTLPVMNGRLAFNADTERFTYLLMKPIIKKDGSGSIEMVEVRETTMDENKVIQRYGDKERVDQALALIAKSCDIEVGFASRLHQRDIRKINALAIGFFVGGSNKQ